MKRPYGTLGAARGCDSYYANFRKLSPPRPKTPKIFSSVIKATCAICCHRKWITGDSSFLVAGNAQQQLTLLRQLNRVQQSAFRLFLFGHSIFFCHAT